MLLFICGYCAILTMISAIMFEKKGNYQNPLNESQILVSAELNDWNGAEADGQLSVDVLEKDDALIVVATMAGTKPEDISLHLHNDFLTIRGRRLSPVAGPAHYFYEECYWGKFSRTIVLPVDVKSELAESEYRNGVLTIRLPKASPKKNIPILVIED